jgi:hypothetical protein
MEIKPGIIQPQLSAGVNLNCKVVSFVWTFTHSGDAPAPKDGRFSWRQIRSAGARPGDENLLAEIEERLQNVAPWLLGCAIPQGSLQSVG